MESRGETQAAVPGPGHATLPRRRTTLPIAGLTSGGALSVERALQKVPGVIRAYANPAIEMAYVEYDPRRTGLAALKVAIESAGFRNGEDTPPEAKSDAGEAPETKGDGDES